MTIAVKVVGTADYFPTLYPDEKSFVVVDIVRLVDYLNSRTTTTAKGPNELWLKLVDTKPEDVQTNIVMPLVRLGVRGQASFVAEEEISSRITQPLLVAGWSGLLLLSFFTVVLASASSVLLYSYMESRERQMEFALLRTLGFSRAQLFGVVWFGLVLMVTSGIVLGTWVGQLAGTAVLPLLEVAEQGSRVTPPMTLHVNWIALVGYYVVLAVAVIITCGVLARILARREIQQVLRIGGA
jgi:ABC-type antimicrobial peptide transport system permease subunit